MLVIKIYMFNYVIITSIRIAQKSREKYQCRMCMQVYEWCLIESSTLLFDIMQETEQRLQNQNQNQIIFELRNSRNASYCCFIIHIPAHYYYYWLLLLLYVIKH